MSFTTRYDGSPAISARTARATRPIELSALPLTVNLTLYAGDDFAMTITVRDMAGEPYDLADAAIRAQIRVRPESEVVLGEFAAVTLGNLIALQLVGVLSAALPALSVYDVELAEPGRTLTLIGGQIRMQAQVTRDDH